MKSSEPSRAEMISNILGRCFASSADFSCFCECFKEASARVNALDVLPQFVANLYDNCMKVTQEDQELCSSVTKITKAAELAKVVDFK